MRFGFHICRRAGAGLDRCGHRDLSIKAPNPDFEVTSMSAATAEGRHRQGLMTKPKVLLMERTQPRHRCRRQKRTSSAHAPACRRGARHPLFHLRPRRGHGVSDRIAVMSNGRLVTVIDRADATEEMIVKASAEGHKTTREHA
ncbi:hypothetical protein F2981_27105 (plasmid) [Sinorhizobium meliloti]|nr:hypothetical protein [Sinorhizobium meliloti]